MIDQPPIAIDCFAGAGGLSLGLIQAGFDVRAAFDNFNQAVATYRSNIGDHILMSNVEEISGHELVRAAGCFPNECALVVGGPPCQGFSRQRRGDPNDDRNVLVLEFQRIVSEIMPELFLMENVPTILGQRGGGFLRTFVAESQAYGYHVSAAVLDAADFGVPQRRKRAFIVGERLDCAPTFEFPSPTHNRDSWVTVRDAIGDLPSPISEPNRAALIPNHRLDNMSELNRLRISFVPQGGGRDQIPAELRLPCHSVSVEKAGHRQVFGRLHWQQPAATITTKCNSFTRGKFAHPEEHRNITMREAARLQTFPDSFRFLGGTVPIAHQVGNAVPPLLACRLGGALLEALRRRRSGEPSSYNKQLLLPIPR